MTVYRAGFANNQALDSWGTIWPLKSRLGIGTTQITSAPFSGTGRDMQLISWSGTKSNGTINLMTNSNLSEVPVSGIIGFAMAGSGQGTCRVYSFIGRYIAATLNQIQGGTRSAGEDASIGLTCTGNDFGITLTSSGYPAGTGYVVWMVAGVQIQGGYTSPNDRWLSDN